MSKESDHERERAYRPPPYVYRRDLEPAEMLPAVGIGIGVGLLAFYGALILLQRTPLEPAPRIGRNPAQRRPGDD